MSKITNEEVLSQIIMGQSRHQFIYGYNGLEREEKLKKIISKYPMVLDSEGPMGIYIPTSEFPSVPKDIERLEIPPIVMREYCSFVLAKTMVDAAIEQIGRETMESRSEKFLERFNSMENLSMESLQEFRDLLVLSKDKYASIYQYCAKTGNRPESIDDLPLPFLTIEFFIRYFKRMMNTSSYLGIIIDQQQVLDLPFQQVLNGLISRRSNGDISVKVACEPQEWLTSYSLDGEIIENIHDYGTVEIDDCFDGFMKKLKKDSGR